MNLQCNKKRILCQSLQVRIPNSSPINSVTPHCNRKLEGSLGMRLSWNRNGVGMGMRLNGNWIDGVGMGMRLVLYI